MINLNVEIRIYKRYDTDLLALHFAGYSVTKMMTDALVAYANSRPYHLFLDEICALDLNDKKNLRLRLIVGDNDYNTISLIRSIKHGYRSNFCKQVLRNALIQQNVLCYMADEAKYRLHDINAGQINTAAITPLISCSTYRQNKSRADTTKESNAAPAYNECQNQRRDEPKKTMKREQASVMERTVAESAVPRSAPQPMSRPAYTQESTRPALASAAKPTAPQQADHDTLMAMFDGL